ncbi:tautomerase family protein [Roseivivax marinus]|uniref:tautomerase family protein n=1 Tax=Roseivivax marinus TaxID=1379903 RepID=UPI00273F73B2|nr:tautomerase family protein [Roseivivax marinus]
MPAIDIQLLEGVFSPEEHARLIEEVTAGFRRVAGDTLAANLSVRVHEIRSGAWGYGGTVLRTEDGQAMRERG